MARRGSTIPDKPPATGFEVTVEKRVARLTIHRPPLNVLTIESCRGLIGAVHGLAGLDEVGVLVLAGAGKAFSAGVDVGEHRPEQAHDSLHAFHGLCRALFDFPRPTIARVHGAALGGGCELVLCCDLAIAGASATLGLPEITLGVFPPAAAVLLPRLAGRRAAMEAILWGEALPAEEALRLRLVSEVVPDRRLDARVRERAARVASLSGVALRAARKAIRRGAVGPVDDALRAVEEMYLKEMMRSEDALEGLDAFLEKRRPVWRQR
ncbi:MAG TPA: enoyl-CoA hydratase-related protein [Patescibacteria group bacterium]|nr:enoyl-CoA hydratase-related protein [Patescibacteria group bacterium]